MSKNKVGLALGSGAARGLAHVGVLKVLAGEGIPIDMIAGTSAGSIVGSLYAMGTSISKMEAFARILGQHKYSYLLDPGLPRTGFLKGRKIREILAPYYNNTAFKDLKIPFSCVATDIETGEIVIMNKGPVLDAVIASSSIPIVLSAVELDGRRLVDGGLVDPVPINVLRNMGADVVIAVNVTPAKIQKSDALRTHGIFHIVMQTLHIATYQITAASLTRADIVIEPPVEHIGPFDFQRVDECIQIGEETAVRIVPAIKKLLAERGVGVN